MARYQYPAELGDTEKHPATILFKFFERGSSTSSSESDEVHLYMPESAQNPSTVSWDTEKLGMVGNYIAANGRSMVDGMDSFKARLGQVYSAENIGDMAQYAFYQSVAQFGSKTVAMMGGNASAEGLMGTVTGKIPNPYLTMVFRGVDFRSFSFVFKFTPYSEKDCDTIDAIIKTFRRNALPEKDGFLFSYPKECEISYHWKGQENKFMHRFKRAVCTALDIDYTGTGMFSTMRNGFPSTIIMSTKWSELEVVTSEDITDPTSNGVGGF